MPFEVQSMIDSLKRKGGGYDVFSTTLETMGYFEENLDRVRAAKLLNLVDTDDTAATRVNLTPVGMLFARSNQRLRKIQWREQLLTWPFFVEFVRFMEAQPKRRASQKEVEAFLKDRIKGNKTEEAFKTIVEWGRFGSVLIYDQGLQRIRLSRGPKLT